MAAEVGTVSSESLAVRMAAHRMSALFTDSVMAKTSALERRVGWESDMASTDDGLGMSRVLPRIF